MLSAVIGRGGSTSAAARTWAATTLHDSTSFSLGKTTFLSRSVFLRTPPQSRTAAWDRTTCGSLSARYGTSLNPKGLQPPLNSPRRSGGPSPKAPACTCALRWRLPAMTSFNGSRSRTLLLSLFCFFISVAASENPVRSATNTPFNVAAQRICHLYGSFGSRKMPTPSNTPNTAPMNTTLSKRIRI